MLSVWEFCVWKKKGEPVKGGGGEAREKISGDRLEIKGRKA